MDELYGDLENYNDINTIEEVRQVLAPNYFHRFSVYWKILYVITYDFALTSLISNKCDCILTLYLEITLKRNCLPYYNMFF